MMAATQADLDAALAAHAAWFCLTCGRHNASPNLRWAIMHSCPGGAKVEPLEAALAAWARALGGV